MELKIKNMLPIRRGSKDVRINIEIEEENIDFEKETKKMSAEQHQGIK